MKVIISINQDKIEKYEEQSILKNPTCHVFRWKKSAASRYSEKVKPREFIADCREIYRR